MKLQEVVFQKPIVVLQVFKTIYTYGKETKSFADRKEIVKWKEINSCSGFVSENELYLPESILQNPDLRFCDLLTLEDDNLLPKLDNLAQWLYKLRGLNFTPATNSCFYVNQTNNFEIFEIRNKSNLELTLKYDYFTIGSPKRSNIKLCNIKEKKPVEIKINGKTDFSNSSRRTRVFKEQIYIIEHIGSFERCKILKKPLKPKVKHIPSDRKVVDLMKPLW
jgi:hypothetical protein